MSDTDTPRPDYSDPYVRRADDALRAALDGCESGPRMIQAVALALESIGSEIAGGYCDDIERAYHEAADQIVPVYTYERGQMLAESLHHMTHEPEYLEPTTDAVELAGAILESIARQALAFDRDAMLERYADA